MTNAFVVIHLLAGSLVVISGFVLLPFKKGASAHKLLGRTFLIAMIVLGLTGVYIAFARSIMLSLLNGLFVCYFVMTAWLVITKPANTVDKRDWLLAGLVAGLASMLVYFARETANSTNGMLGGFGAEAYYFFAMIAAGCAIADIRYIMIGGLAGNRRVTRHLWRMFFPHFMATTAFFLGQAKLFPEALQVMKYLAVPSVLILLSMGWWVLRVKFMQPWRKIP